jgi:hypothetical protein
MNNQCVDKDAYIRELGGPGIRPSKGHSEWCEQVFSEKKVKSINMYKNHESKL